MTAGTAGQRGSGAATARETGARLTEAAPLNAVLHWSQDLLDAEGGAGRRDAGSPAHSRQCRWR